MNRDYTALIEAELGRLNELSTQKAKRDRTIEALAQAAVDNEPVTSAFEKPGVIGMRTYYHKQKPWYHDDLFREVLGNVTELYLQREIETRQAAEERGRKERHERRVRLINAAHEKASLLVQQMDIARQRPDHVARFVAVVIGEERKEFDELAAKKVDVTSGGKPVEPGGNAAAIAVNTVGGVNLDDMDDDDLDQLITNLTIAVGARARQTT